MKKNMIQKLAIAAALVAMGAGSAMAQTDITQTISTVDGYLTAAIAVGITVLLFTLGRAIVRKVAR